VSRPGGTELRLSSFEIGTGTGKKGIGAFMGAASRHMPDIRPWKRLNQHRIAWMQQLRAEYITIQVMKHSHAHNRELKEMAKKRAVKLRDL